MASRRDDLARCLASLAAAEGADRLEVLVVSWRGERMELPATSGVDLRSLKSAFRGAAGKKNEGFRVARGAIVAFLDDDAVVREDYPGRLLEAFADGVDYVGGVVEPIFDVPPPPEIAGVVFSVGGFNRHGSDERREAWMSANCAFRRGFLGSLGLFDPRLGPGGSYLPWGEDSEMFRRASVRGRGVFAGEVVVRHRIQADRLTVRYLLRRAWLAGRTLCLIDRRHKPGYARRALPVPLYALRTGLAAARRPGDLAVRVKARRFAGYTYEALRLALLGMTPR
jgi:glycosyltransferase involved in cell wall biosynthesis